MNLRQVELIVRRNSAFGFQYCTEQHGQILSVVTGAPLVNVWINKKLGKNVVKYQRVGSFLSAKLGGIEKAILEATLMVYVPSTPTATNKDGTLPLDVGTVTRKTPTEDRDGKLSLEVGNVTIALKRSEWLKVVADASRALMMGELPF